MWAFAHILKGARIGVDCNICDHTFIEGGAVVGDRVTVKCGVQLWDGVTLEDDVFVGPNATFTNDPFPRSGRRPAEFTRTLVRRGASIGANATLLPGVTVGPQAVDQKENWSTLDLSNTFMGPSTTSLSLPTVNEPSLPAVNLSPSAPVILPSMSALAAYAAR